MENTKRYYGVSEVLHWKYYRMVEAEKSIQYYEIVTIMEVPKRLSKRIWR